MDVRNMGIELFIENKKGLIGVSEIDKIIFTETNPEDFINFVKIDKKIHEEIIEILPSLVQKWYNSDDITEIPELTDNLLKINELEIVRLILDYSYDPYEDFELYSRIIKNNLCERNEHIFKYILTLIPDNFNWENINHFFGSGEYYKNLKEYFEFSLNASIDAKSVPMIDIIINFYNDSKGELMEQIPAHMNYDTEKEQHKHEIFIDLEPLINKATFISATDKMKKSWIHISKDYDQSEILEIENAINKLDKLR